jgi:hypothetical protein
MVAALFVFPSVWAAVQVVDYDGTLYSATVEPSAQRTGGQSDATQIVVLRLPTTGAQTRWVIDPTQDVASDKDPVLLLAPGASGPTLLWSRRNGRFSQIAISRLEGEQWSPLQYLTNGPRQHVRPEAGVDTSGTGYVVWVEQESGGSVSFATFDPILGNLLSSPRDLLLELVRHSPPEWLIPEESRHSRGPKQLVDPVPSPDGGNEAPIIPPSNAQHVGEPIGGAVTLNPACPKALAAVVKNRGLWIGIFQNGVVLNYYRSQIPPGAPDDYLALFLQSLLNQHCQ